MQSVDASSRIHTEHYPLTVGVIRGEVLGDRHLPPVTVGQELLLVVQQFLVGFSGEFVVRALHNSVHRAGFLRVRIDAQNGIIGGRQQGACERLHSGTSVLLAARTFQEYHYRQ